MKVHVAVESVRTAEGGRSSHTQTTTFRAPATLVVEIRTQAATKHVAVSIDADGRIEVR